MNTPAKRETASMPHVHPITLPLHITALQKHAYFHRAVIAGDWLSAIRLAQKPQLPTRWSPKGPLCKIVVQQLAIHLSGKHWRMWQDAMPREYDLEHLSEQILQHDRKHVTALAMSPNWWAKLQRWHSSSSNNKNTHSARVLAALRASRGASWDLVLRTRSVRIFLECASDLPRFMYTAFLSSMGPQYHQCGRIICESLVLRAYHQSVFGDPVHAEDELNWALKVLFLCRCEGYMFDYRKIFQGIPLESIMNRKGNRTTKHGNKSLMKIQFLSNEEM